MTGPRQAGAMARPWWLGIAVVLLGAVWLAGAAVLPQRARYAEVGPGMFVTLVGAGLVLLGLILLVQIARGERFEPQAAEDAAAEAPASLPSVALASVAAALPIVLMQPLGLPLTSAISFALVARAFGSRRLVFDVAIGILLGAAAWYGFRRLGVTLGGFFPAIGP